MGYQIVSVELRDGRVYDQVFVFTSPLLGVCDINSECQSKMKVVSFRVRQPSTDSFVKTIQDETTCTIQSVSEREWVGVVRMAK